MRDITDDDLAAIATRAVRIAASGYQSPAEWLLDALGGAPSEAGVRVSYRDAMSLAYVYSAVSIISSDVAGLPLNEYRREDDGDLLLERMSYAGWVLNGDANEYQSGYSLRETLTAHALLRGNGLAAIERDLAGRPLRLIPILPGAAEPRLTEDRQLVWDLRGVEETLPDADMLNIRGLGEDGVIGHSVLTLAKNSFGLGLAQEKHGAQYFKNGARPSLALKTPHRLDKAKADELLDQWEQRHASSSRPALLHGGLDLELLPISNSDAQWLGSREFSARQIAVWFQLPPHKLGDASRVGYAGVEAENRAYLQGTLSRWLRRWETECERKLLGIRQRVTGSRVMAHDTMQLLEPDLQSRATAAATLRAAEVVTSNEARRWFRLPSRPDGDELTNPNKATRLPGSPGGQPDESPAERTAAPATAASAHRRLVASTVERMSRIERTRAVTAAGNPDKFLAWLDTFYEEFPATLAGALEPVLAACTEHGALAVDASAVATRHCDESRRLLLEVAGSATPSRLSDLVSAEVAGWPSRTDEIVSQTFGN